MKVFVCKMCGRAITVADDKIPFYCYFDRMSMMEAVDEEKAKKMGIYIPGKFAPLPPVTHEFPGDVCFDVFTGEDKIMHGIIGDMTLNNWQIAKLYEFIAEGRNNV